MRLSGWVLYVKKTLQYEESLRHPEKTRHFIKRWYGFEQRSFDLVYVDETGFSPTTYRPYGRAPKGKSIIGYRASAQRPRTSLLGGYLKNKLIAPMLFDGTCNTIIFNEWLRHFMLPNLTRPSVIILDNAAFHKARSTLTLIKEAGHRLLFLPPYSPHLNPIEKLWANIKRTWQFNQNISIEHVIKQYY